MFHSLPGVRLAPRGFMLLVLFLVLALADGNAQAGVLSGSCRTSDQPAATLLIPYFEVDLDQADGATTLVSLNNASARPTVARVVLWTDWGVPTLAFDVYLTGYDVQRLDIRELFAGTLPVTGPSVSPVGVLSQQDVVLSGCGEPNPKSKNARPAGQLSRVERVQLRAAHTGRPVGAAAPPRCLSSERAERGLAIGYITVDVVNRCTPRSMGTAVNTPAHPGYFADGGTGLASNSNILWGEYFYVDKRKNRAVSQPAVHIVADADTFEPGDYTFYGRYVGFDSRDNRAPLSSLYYARYFDRGDVFSETDLVVWRDNRQAAATGYDCAQGPSWAPLGEFQLVTFDEEENPTEIRDSNAFPLTAQKVGVGSRALPVRDKYGWLSIDLWHKDETHAQGWVTVLMSTEGRYSTGHAAVRVDDLCNFGM